MTLHQRLVMGYAAGVGPGGSGWNPADALSGHFTFSNSNRRIESASSATGSVRGVVSNSSGKRYFEVFITVASGNTWPWVGVCSSAFSLSGQPVFVTIGQAMVAWRGNTQFGNDGGFIGLTGTAIPTITGTATVGIGVDFGTRTVSIYNNGVPAGSAATYATGFGAMFPMGTIESLGPGNLMDLRTLSTELSFLPATYSPWE